MSFCKSQLGRKSTRTPWQLPRRRKSYLQLVSDGENEVVQSFTLNVLPPVTINTPPVITSILTSGAMKDREYVYQATASDVDGDDIEWSLDVSSVPESAKGDIQIDKDTGLFTWTPRVSGQFTFTIIASDGRDSVAQIITLPVANNAPPVIASLPTNTTGKVGEEYVSQIIAGDPNGDELTYKLENAPEGMAVDDGGIITWSEPVAGQYIVTIIVADTEGVTAQRQFSLQIIDPNIPNEPPQITNTPPSTIPVSKQFTFQFAASDPENDAITFNLENAPEGMILSSGGRIEWNPTSEGQVSFSVKIDDGTNALIYTYTIEVVAQRVNGQPVFTSTPPESVLVNKQFKYQPTATDPDGDSITFSLVNAPTGMVLNNNGEIVWTPTNALLGQKVPVTVRAVDAYGAISEQTFELAVRSVAQPPTVAPDAVPYAVVGQSYSYKINATDPQNEKLRYSISGETYGATIDKDSGQLTWTPQTEGVFAISINVFNESGRGVAMTLPIQVFASAPNNKPYFTQLESQYVELGKGWSFKVGAADWDSGDQLIYSLDNNSLARGLTIDSATGLVTWSTPTGSIGQNVAVKVMVSDGKDEISGTFTLVLTAANVLPELKNVSDQVATAGSKFLYNISATDENRDKLTFSIDESSRNLGITIDSATGQITWSPTRDNIRNENYPVTVSVSDGRGDVVSKTFNIKVVEDTIAPIVNISVSPTKTSAGQTVTISISATDNVGVVETKLRLVSITKNDGTVIDIDKDIKLTNGKATYTLAADEFGHLAFEAIAKDAQGNISTKLAAVQAINPNDTERPIVSITSHSQGSKIVGPVDIIGTVKDNESGVNWTLKAISLETGNEIVIANGTGNIENSTIGRFDTTMLRNGTYQIILTAIDSGGNESEKYFNVELEGTYKLGNFNMSFTDLDLQLGGLPITITRTYDTLNADVQGDFGYGWSLDIATTEISVVIGNGANAQKGFSRYEPIQDGTHITITLPDGTKEGFTFQPKSANSSSSPFAGIVKTPYYYPAWVPDVGTKSTLAVPQILMYAWGDGTYYMMDDYGDGMNDYSPAAGSAFLTLTLRNGVDLVIDATTGKLCEAVDLTGSKLTFSEHGITHSSGKGVVFERDYEGRISAITGPDGRRVEYSYDAKGDLVAVKDQSNATVQFTYLTDPKAPEHYLDQVIDPLGRTAAKTEFDEQGRIKKVIDAEGKVIEYNFDTESRIQKVTDQLGNTTIIENDDQGNVIREVSPEGNITLHTYDSKGNTLSETTVVIHNGQEVHLTTSYTYDADSNKLSETDARGNVTNYVYNKYGQVTSTTSNGITTITNYDQNTGLPKTTVDANGNSTTYGFDSKGNMTSLTNSNGVQLINSTYNKYGEVTSITSTNGRTTYMEYDNNGDCVATYYVENGVKILDETIYDNARKVIGRKHYIAGELIWETKTEYNIAGQVIKEIDQNGLITEYTYDIRGLETEVRSQSKGTDGQVIWNIQRTVYDAAGRATYSNSYVEGINVTKINGSYTEYDKDGRSVRSEQLLGLIIELDSNGRSYVKSNGSVIALYATEYNSAGWILSSTDSNGLRTEYVYDVFGETTQTRHELIGGGWIVSETVYDSQGRVIFSTDSHVEGSTDPVYGTKSLYDSKGRSVGSVRYKGSEISLSADGTATVAQYGTEIYRTTTEYDSKGRVKSSTDAYGNATTYEYDTLDRQVIVKQADGIITETVYDKQGRVWKSIIKSGNDARTTEYKYDMYGNIIETIQPDGTTIKAAYNNKGQKISETNQLGQTRHFEYDDNGQLIQVTLPDGATYKYAYDASGNQTSIIDPLNRETKFTYDDNGNQLTRTLPDGSTEYFEYDYKGRLIRQISFEGVATTYSYDEFERLASKTSTANGITETWVYTYDQFGRVSEIDQAGRVVKTTYDAQGRTQSIETPEGIISYTYDMFGRQTSVQTDDDQPVIYTYDNFGRLSSVTSDGKTTTYEYDAFGSLAKTTLPNGVITIYEYDNMNRLTKETNYIDKNNNGKFDKDQGEGVAQFEYSLDAQGRKLSAKEKFWLEFGEQENNIDWIYDDDGRLIYEKFDHYYDTFDQTSEWIYDLVGNRLRQTVDKGNDGTIDEVTKYTYDKNDRLLKEQHDAQNDGNFEKTITYGYDHTQQTSKVVNENGVIVSTATYKYDLQGRMSGITAVIGNRTEITKYEYGTDGIRISTEHESYIDGILQSKIRTEYLKDPNSLTGYSQVLRQTEYDTEGNVIKTVSYIIGHQRISQTVEFNGESTTHYFTFDGHGSTRVLLDVVGAIVQLYSFDAYGNAIGFDPSIALTEFLYNGEQFDSKIGQQYLRARYYDPATGRFNRLDPFFGVLNDPASLHGYLYVSGDPVNNYDPTGNVTTGFGQRAHAVISALYVANHFGNNVRLGLGLPGFAGIILPDILDMTLAEIGDIKPLSQYGFRTGEVQVNAAVALANGVKTTYHGTVYTPSVALAHYNAQRPLWIPMTWNPEGIIVPISATEAAMIIGTLNGVLYYLGIPKIKQPFSSPVVVPESVPITVPATDSVFKTIAQDILRDIQSGLAADPIQQLIYSIKIEHAAAAVGLVTLGLGGATLVSNANRLRLSMANVITVPICTVMCVGF